MGPTFLRHAGSISRAGGASRARGSSRGRMCHHGQKAIDIGRGDLKCPSRPQDATHPTYSLAPEDVSGGLDGS
jgi:hypothetical protein